MLGLMRLSERARAVEDAARARNGVAEALDRFREAAPDVQRYLGPRTGGGGA
jgi:hypothetical protein